MQAIRKRLLAWYDRHRRDLPWRRTRDPYRVLVSEVMLQQTRVAAALPYYRRFLRSFPTSRALARAPSAKVLHAWAGLGYYSRARRLREAARIIARHGFPSTYDGVRALPGIGPYTAAAIMSIVFQQPYAAVDGNVRRVLSRLFGSADAGQTMADALLDRNRPGDFNQALMEFGATVCLPRNPACSSCPLAANCHAYRNGRVDHFPVRKKKRSSVELRLRLAFFLRGKSVLLQPPSRDGFWPGFWTLPALRLKRPRLVAQFSHTVTFRRMQIQVYTGEPITIRSGLAWVPMARLAFLPLATPARKTFDLLNQAVRAGTSE